MNFLLKKEKKIAGNEIEWWFRGGFEREVHLQSALRPFLPITLYLEPPRVVL
jgi:hypothetical protein